MNFHSQVGQDRFLLEHFFRGHRGGVFVDIGAYDGQTFKSLGVTPGTYKWTWGTGANQNFTLVIETVQEPSTWAMMLIGFAGLGFMGYQSAGRRRPT